MMRLRHLVFFIFFLLFTPGLANMANMANMVKAAEVVSLEQYLELVRQNNRVLQANLRHLEAAYYTVRASVGYQRPSLSTSAGGSYLTRRGRSIFEERDITSGNVEVTLSWRISLSDAFSLDEQQQVLNFESQRARFEDSVNSLMANAEEIYWTTVFARENIALQQTILYQWLENMRITEEKFEQRLIPRLDLVRAESQVVAAESFVSQAEMEYRNLLLMMASLAGRIMVTPIEESLVVPEFSISPEIEEAVLSRPSVRAERLDLYRSRIAHRLAAKGLSPTLDLGVSWTPLADPWNAAHPQRGEMAASLRLNIPIIDGNETRHRTRGAARSVSASEASLQSAVDSAITELEVALNNWENALILERDRRRQVERSNEELDITELLYHEGMGAQIDLINAQTENQRVRTEHLYAVKGIYLAQIEVRRVIGDYSLSEERETPAFSTNTASAACSAFTQCSEGFKTEGAWP